MKVLHNTGKLPKYRHPYWHFLLSILQNAEGLPRYCSLLWPVFSSEGPQECCTASEVPSSSHGRYFPLRVLKNVEGLPRYRRLPMAGILMSVPKNATGLPNFQNTVVSPWEVFSSEGPPDCRRASEIPLSSNSRYFPLRVLQHAKGLPRYRRPSMAGILL